MENCRTRPLARRIGIRSLQFKASLLVVLLILAVAGIDIVLSLSAMNALLYRNEHARALATAQAVAASTASGVTSADTQWLARTSERLVRAQGIAYVMFLDAEGQLLASAARYPEYLNGLVSSQPRIPTAEELARTQFTEDAATGQGWIHVVAPVRLEPVGAKAGKANGRLDGYVRLAIEVTETQLKSQQIARTYVHTIFLILAMVILCSLIVTKHIIGPINALARASRQLASGVMDARVEVHSKDEIGDLGDAFNIMADRVAATQMEMMNLNAELEQRVLERTRELQELASRDPLTGLYNRRYFTAVMGHEFAAAERYERDLTCLMFDLDLFKEVNDTFGHRTGDEVLCLLAEAIRGTQRGSDVAARWGGDEFILLLPHSSSADAAVVAERIQVRFASLVRERLPGISVGVSIGVSSLRTTLAGTCEALINEADMALYAAKEVSHTHLEPVNRRMAV